MKSKVFKVSSVFAALSFAAPSLVQAHGWVEFPEARQSICYEQGGFWSGDIPNAACDAAHDISGAYPFIQRNEVAINIPAPHYLDMERVKEAIPNGTLCYANDSQKSGLGVEHQDWTRTEIAPGEFELVFNATAPHNPSFWEIYLTKPGVDVSKPLNWDDLELIEEFGNITAGSDKKYRMNVTIPSDRSGDAVMFTRWQRIDPVGEGFYNCSDLSITGDGGPIDPPEGPYLEKGSLFIPSDVELDTPEVGDSVQYKVFGSEGVAHASFSLKITEENQQDWDRLLAADVNGYYDTQHSGDVFIGDWHEEMNHYMYFRNDLQANFFNSKDAQGYGEFTIVPDDGSSDLKAVVTPQTLQAISQASVEHGELVVLHPKNTEGEYDSAVWTQTSGPHLDVTYGAYDEVFINTTQLDDTQDHEVTFQLTVSEADNTDSTVYSFAVTADDDSGENPGEAPAWTSGAVYNQGDSAEHDGELWTAQWWTQGEEPGTTGEWGVWRR